VANYGPPGDPNYPGDEPTTYLGEQPLEPEPWYRKPAALVALGALGALLIALIVFGLARLITGGDEPTESSTLTPLTTTSRSAAPITSAETVTETITPSTTAPPTTTTPAPTTTTTTTTTEPSTSVSVSTSTETSTVTETVTSPPPAP
jgi:cytoskeletal protein RodZ